MTNETNQMTPKLDRADTRVRHDAGLAGALKKFSDQVRSGDLGMLPVIIGLLLISAVFTSLNPVFLAPNNLVNLLFDAAAVGLIALGVVCVLLLGEIDLSIGSMSGLSSAIIGVLWVNSGVPLAFAILAVLVNGALIGFIYGFLRNKFEMPSFARAVGYAALYPRADWVDQLAVHVAPCAVWADFDHTSDPVLFGSSPARRSDRDWRCSDQCETDGSEPEPRKPERRDC